MNAQAKFSHSEFAAFRRVSGEEFGRLCVSLADWDGWPQGVEVYQPSEKTAECTRAELASAKELLASRSPLEPERLATKKMHENLRGRVASLNESIPDASIASLKRDPTAHGGYFLSLVLDDESGAALEAERNRLWQAMELIAGAPVGSSGWKPYHPNIRLAYIKPDAMNAMPAETFKNICTVIEGTAHGLPVDLAAAELPTIQD